MKIEIESAMREAARAGLDAYQPLFRGQPLEVEKFIPEVSLGNLKVMLKAGLEVSTMTVVEDGHVLVAFETGETYLATGFAVGPASDLTLAFAKFAAKAFPVSAEEFLPGDPDSDVDAEVESVKAWESVITGLYAEDHRGPVSLELPRRSGLGIVGVEEDDG